MDKKNKSDFDEWMRTEAPRLYKELQDKDSLHDAYIIVVKKPKAERTEYDNLVSKAYLAARRYYRAYAMRYLLKEPLFWIFQAMKPDEEYEEVITEDRPKSNGAMSEYVRRHFSQMEYAIYYAFRINEMTIEEIAKQFACSKEEVTATITRIFEDYKKHKRHGKKKRNNK